MGIQAVSPDQLNEGFSEAVQVNELYTFGADLLFFLPDDLHPALKNFGLGLRFDSLSSYKVDLQVNSLEIAARLFSLFAQKRWYWDSFYIAGGGTIGVYQPSVVNIQMNTGPWVVYDAKSVQSFSLGAEAGWVLDIYLVSLEAGYQFLKLSELTAGDGTQPLTPSGAAKSANLNGPYAKLVLGLHFD